MDETRLLEIIVKAAHYPDPAIRKMLGDLVTEVHNLQKQIRANNQHIDQLEKTIIEYDRGELKW